MQTGELPILEDSDEVRPWPETPAENFVEHEVDLAAFELWRKASHVENAAEEEDTSPR